MKIGKYHYQIGYNLSTTKINRIVAIDTEWAKNWKREEKFTPFCASFHSIYIDDISDVINLNNLSMETELYFRSEKETTQEYVNTIESIIKKYMNKNTLFVGHQISSDLHSIAKASTTKLESIQMLINTVKKRKNTIPFHEISLRDTRYDIVKRIIGNGGEKLRNVSLRYRIFAIQTELDKMSLTKMYNQYLLDSDKLKRELLTIMNLRHSFQTALIYLIELFPNSKIFNEEFQKDFVLTNDIIFKMGKDYFEYLNSLEYKETCTIQGIKFFLNKNAPEVRF